MIRGLIISLLALWLVVFYHNLFMPNHSMIMTTANQTTSADCAIVCLQVSHNLINLIQLTVAFGQTNLQSFLISLFLALVVLCIFRGVRILSVIHLPTQALYKARSRLHFIVLFIQILQRGILAPRSSL